ncbi:MAG: translation initiation factor IF-2 [Patescibacteria group bacterium]
MQKKRYPQKKSDKKKRAQNRRSFATQNNIPEMQETATRESRGEILIPAVITVKDFAVVTGLPVTSIISELMKNGILANINQTIDFETAAIIADDLGISVKEKEEENPVESQEKAKIEISSEGSEIRPPVVTIMGHVDHGKTSLLDKIREAHVAEGESGGITQHISAYQVTLNKVKSGIKNRTITFIDTPGHAAFSALRSHGAAITDIVVLIVAANDGVMPQTQEVIEQIKLHHVPVIVAINKIDLPDADVMKVKQQLSEYELVPEEWGGKTPMVEVSAKTGIGIDNLLELILLQADLMELKANPSDKAVGVVIESHMHKGAGALALALIENGTLKVGDPVQIGSSWGKVRILEDYQGRPIKSAPPSFPARVAGLKSLPTFGDKLIAYDNEKEAREAASQIKESISIAHVATAQKVGIEEVADDIATGKSKELNIVLKADVNGSLQAIKKSFNEIDTQEIKMNVVSEGIGTISESDITFAKATKAIIIGFRVKVLQAALKIAEKEKIPVELYDVIYKLIEDVKGALSGMLPPEIIEDELGGGEILAIFRDDKKGVVAGARLDGGKAAIGNEIKVFQNDNEKWRGKILSLRREKDEVKEVDAGIEFGFGADAGAKIAVGDKIIIFKTIEKPRTIE